MGPMASQITSISIVYSTVYSGADQRKHQSSAPLAFVRGILPGTGEFPAQMASNAENIPFNDIIMSLGMHHVHCEYIWYVLCQRKQLRQNKNHINDK